MGTTHQDPVLTGPGLAKILAKGLAKGLLFTRAGTPPTGRLRDTPQKVRKTGVLDSAKSTTSQLTKGHVAHVTTGLAMPAGPENFWKFENVVATQTYPVKLSRSGRSCTMKYGVQHHELQRTVL